MHTAKSYPDILALFIKALQKKAYQPSTIAAYESDLQLFFSFLEKNGFALEFESLQLEQIHTYILYLQASGRSKATISRHMTTLKTMATFLFEEKILSTNIALYLKPLAVQRQIAATLSIEEIDLLCDIPDRTTPLGRRDLAIIELLYGTGIPIGELVPLKTHDLFVEMGYIKCGKAERMIPFPDSLTDLLRQYLEVDRPFIKKEIQTDILFLNAYGKPMTRQGFWSILTSIGAKANIKVHPELLRDTFTKHMLHNGAPIESLKIILGMKDFSFLDKFEPREQNLKTILRKFHPRQ